MSDSPYFVVACIAEHIEPNDRVERYEGPLDDALQEAGLGQVVGGGTHFSQTEGVHYGEIEIELADLDRGLDLCTRILVAQGAPAGSYFVLHHGCDPNWLPFGAAQCTAVFLDGVYLPTEVYEVADINKLAVRLKKDLGDDVGEIRGSWAGRSETSILIYGLDAHHIASAIDATLRTYPLCENARVVVGYRHPDGPFTEYRIPIHG